MTTEDLANLLLSLVRCRPATVADDRDRAALPVADLYPTLAFAVGATCGEVTDALRAVCRTGQVELSGDGRWLRLTADLTPRQLTDMHAVCDLSDRLYDRLRGVRETLGIDDGVAAFIE